MRIIALQYLKAGFNILKRNHTRDKIHPFPFEPPSPLTPNPILRLLMPPLNSCMHTSWNIGIYGFRKVRNQSLNSLKIRWLLKKQENGENIYFCFVDHAKALYGLTTTVKVRKRRIFDHLDLPDKVTVNKAIKNQIAKQLENSTENDDVFKALYVIRYFNLYAEHQRKNQAEEVINGTGIGGEISITPEWYW